jgi:hypothetical protein
LRCQKESDADIVVWCGALLMILMMTMIMGDDLIGDCDGG